MNTEKYSKILQPQLFAKILLSLSDEVGIDLLKSYDWEIYNVRACHYHISGYHPVLARIDYYDHFFIASI